MNNERKQILVVDDSRTMRQLLGMVLTRHLACVVEEAEDGIEAVSKMTRSSFDLVITDINMPRMDGLSLVRSVRQELGLETPIIIVTTMGQEQDRDHGMSQGANSYVTKPVQPPQLLSAVNDLIQ